MSSYQFSPAAIEDLWDIWHYIAIENGNLLATDQLWSDIEKTCEKITKLPILGHRRRDLAASPSPDALFFCVRKNYLIVYRKDTSPPRSLAFCTQPETPRTNFPPTKSSQRL